MINVVVTENRDYLTAEVALEHSWAQQGCLHIKKVKLVHG